VLCEQVYGGSKESGLGREGVQNAMNDYVEISTMLLPWRQPVGCLMLQHHAPALAAACRLPDVALLFTTVLLT